MLRAELQDEAGPSLMAQTARTEPGTRVCPSLWLQGEILTRGEARDASSAAGVSRNRELQMLYIRIAINKLIPPAPPQLL